MKHQIHANDIMIRTLKNTDYLDVINKKFMTYFIVEESL